MSQHAQVRERRVAATDRRAVLRAGSRIRPRDWPFRLKMTVALLAIGLVPAILLLLLLGWRADTQAVSTRNAGTLALARSTAASVGALFADDRSMVQQVTTMRDTVTLFDTAAYTSLNTVLTTAVLPIRASALYVVARDGRIVAATQSSLIRRFAAGLIAVQQVLAGQRAAITVEPASSSGVPVLVVAAPILRRLRTIGVVVAEWDEESLHTMLSPAGATLLLATGRVVDGVAAHSGAPALLVGGAGKSPVTLRLPAFAATRDTQVAPLADGSVVSAIAGDTMSVLVVPPLATSGALLSQTLIRLEVLLLLALTILAVIRTTMALTQPLTLLAQTLASVRAGNYGVRARLRQRDEIGAIGSTVDMLIERTQVLVTDLENQRLELENGIVQLFTELAEAASGNLTVRPTVSEGPLGAVADSVRILLDRFGGTVMQIQATAGAVTIGTSQLAATVLGVSQEAQKQATQLASGADAMAEMASTAQVVSQRTRAATDVAAEAVNAVESGNMAVTNAREAAKRTSETSRRAARQVKSLGESAQLMGNALLLVQHNTEELHLIAGNASIEAARYAESGGVFRTVADSIEQLAQESQGALRQIQSVVESTQRETARVVAAIEEVTAEVMTVAKAIDLAGENFDTINHIVKGLADLNVFIASASEQQARMAVDMAEMIGILNQVSLQTSANTASSAQAAVHLRQLTEELNDSVSTLKVS